MRSYHQWRRFVATILMTGMPGEACARFGEVQTFGITRYDVQIGCFAHARHLRKRIVGKRM